MDPDPQDRRLEEAMRRSPELAAMLSRPRGDPSRLWLRLVGLLGAAALVVLVGWLALKGLGRWRREEPATEIDNSVYLPPIKTEKAPNGEETSPFTGFAVTVDTEPPGATISIGGKLRGEAPVLASIECRGTEKVAVVARKEGFRPTTRELACRADTLVKLTLRLER
jgi:hypothetical protein